MPLTWWRHQMETSSALLALCEGNSPLIGQWRGALMFSLICAWTNGWVNNREAGDLRHHRAHYDVTVMRYLTWNPMKRSKGETVQRFMPDMTNVNFIPNYTEAFHNGQHFADDIFSAFLMKIWVCLSHFIYMFSCRVPSSLCRHWFRVMV